MSPPSRGVDLDNDNDDGDPLHFRKLDDLYASGVALEEAEEVAAWGELLWLSVTGSRPHSRRPNVSSAGSRP